MARIVVGISGASGIILAYKTIHALVELGHTIEMVMSHDAALTARQEMGERFSTPQKFLQSFPEDFQKHIRLHAFRDFGAPIASGSFYFDSCVIVPCSMASLAGIACGLSDNLLRRVADVTLKERRTLVIVPREMPYTEIHLENMLKLTRMGAVCIVPQPAWYMHQQTLSDVEAHIVGRVLDALKIRGYEYPRWQGMEKS